jgi:hypothetical protein
MFRPLFVLPVAQYCAYRQHKNIALQKQSIKQGSTSELQKLFLHIL